MNINYFIFFYLTSFLFFSCRFSNEDNSNKCFDLKVSDSFDSTYQDGRHLSVLVGREKKADSFSVIICLKLEVNDTIISQKKILGEQFNDKLHPIVVFKNSSYTLNKVFCDSNYIIFSIQSIIQPISYHFGFSLKKDRLQELEYFIFRNKGRSDFLYSTIPQRNLYVDILNYKIFAMESCHDELNGLFGYIFEYKLLNDSLIYQKEHKSSNDYFEEKYTNRDILEEIYEMSK